MYTYFFNVFLELVKCIFLISNKEHHETYYDDMICRHVQDSTLQPFKLHFKFLFKYFLKHAFVRQQLFVYLPILISISLGLHLYWILTIRIEWQKKYNIRANSSINMQRQLMNKQDALGSSSVSRWRYMDCGGPTVLYGNAVILFRLHLCLYTTNTSNVIQGAHHEAIRDYDVICHFVTDQNWWFNQSKAKKKTRRKRKSLAYSQRLISRFLLEIRLTSFYMGIKKLYISTFAMVANSATPYLQPLQIN